MCLPLIQIEPLLGPARQAPVALSGATARLTRRVHQVHLQEEEAADRGGESTGIKRDGMGCLVSVMDVCLIGGWRGDIKWRRSLK